MRRHNVCSRNNRALSPIFATVLLAAIVLVFGSVAYYYSSNLTNTATNNYVSSLSGSQQAISQRIGFENVVYTRSSSMLTVYIINSGSANNIKIDSIFIYDQNNTIVPNSPYSGHQISALYPIFAGTPAPTAITSFNVGMEAYFNVTMSGSSLISGSIYTINLITQNGGTFNYEFTP